MQALSLRRQLRDDGPQAAVKAQALAQSHTSLANLYVHMGECASDEELEIRYDTKALHQFELARTAYVKGFHSTHPKVAWAVSGIASMQKKRGLLDEALGDWEEAIRLLTGKGFTAELEKATAAAEELRRELQLRRQFSQFKQPLLSGKVRRDCPTSVGGDPAASPQSKHHL